MQHINSCFQKKKNKILGGKQQKKDIKSVAKDIVVFLTTLDLEVDVLRHAEDLTQSIRIPAVVDITIVQVTLQDGDIIATAAFVSQQDNREDNPVTDDDLLLLDDEDEDTEEYDWYNEPPSEDFGNLNID